jgi:hypothetical protein
VAAFDNTWRNTGIAAKDWIKRRRFTEDLPAGQCLARLGCSLFRHRKAAGRITQLQDMARETVDRKNAAVAMPESFAPER